MIEVLFLVLPGSLLLDLAGPAEALRLANQECQAGGRPPAFRLRFVGPQAEIESSVGLALTRIDPLPHRLPPRGWVVLLGRPGGAGDVMRRQTPWLAARDWLAGLVGPRLASGLELVCVCAGALLAADAGLIGTRQVTTHHELLDDLAALAPAARVLSNRVFVEDGPVWSSAGITAGIDLALHLVARDCGPAIAAHVAQTMAAYTRRGPRDPLLSPLLAHRDHLHPAVHRVQNAVCAAPGELWTAHQLAAAAHVTPRHLARLFARHVRLSPRDYVEQVRSGLAQHAIEAGATAVEAARIAGFGSPRRLRQALRRRSQADPHRAEGPPAG